ncbi:MAG: heavy metal-associated domain-containing protein [Flavobacteriaceae bacterium]
MRIDLNISGMTCENCKKYVTDHLNALPEVNSAIVDLVKGQANLEVSTSIPIEKIQKTLGLKYSVSIRSEKVEGSKIQSPTKLKSLFPLFLVFVYLILGTLMLHLIAPSTFNTTMHRFMGLFFITFSFFKFLDFNGFAPSFARYDPLASKSLLYANAYPFLETALGVAFLLEWQLIPVLVVTIFVLSITTFGVLNALLKKNQIQCACLGTALKLPMTEATLIENGIMIIMSCISLVAF